SGLIVTVVCFLWLVTASDAIGAAIEFLWSSEDPAWWHLIGTELLLAYLLGMPVGRWLEGGAASPPPGPRAGRILLLVVASTIVPSCVAAPFVSKAHWGYYFEKPPMDARV